YGATLSLWDDLARGPMYVIAPVQTEVTDKSLVEILKEVRDIDGRRPITADELSMAKANLVQTYPQLFEYVAGVAFQTEQLFLYDRPIEYWQNDIDQIKALELAEVNEVAQERFDADALAIVIVGDLSQIEEGVRALGLGEVYTMDSSGALVTSGTN
ncbi:MAG: insulinase family protein, partial [Rhodothermales bacterium]|nr:insulinase family protein [Rhodothermales bacterium]